MVKICGGDSGFCSRADSVQEQQFITVIVYGLLRLIDVIVYQTQPGKVRLTWDLCIMLVQLQKSINMKCVQNMRWGF